jgi:hypothetical protein
MLSVFQGTLALLAGIVCSNFRKQNVCPLAISSHLPRNALLANQQLFALHSNFAAQKDKEKYTKCVANLS